MRWVGGSASQLGEEQDSGAIKMAMGAAAGAAASGAGAGGQSVMSEAGKGAQQAQAAKQEAKDDKRHNELMGGLSQANSPTPTGGGSRGSRGSRSE